MQQRKKGSNNQSRENKEYLNSDDKEELPLQLEFNLWHQSIWSLSSSSIKDSFLFLPSVDVGVIDPTGAPKG